MSHILSSYGIRFLFYSNIIVKNCANNNEFIVKYKKQSFTDCFLPVFL